MTQAELKGLLDQIKSGNKAETKTAQQQILSELKLKHVKNIGTLTSTYLKSIEGYENIRA